MENSGYPKNRSKKRDNRSDIMTSLKHDAEAEIGELFWSREVGKLSFKKNIGEFVRYDSPQIITGPTGPIGPQGVPGPVGPAGLEWQGAWVSGATYAIDDAVGYDGASWFCIAATSGTTAPDADPTHWALLAAQGATGPQGPQGDPGVFNGPEILAIQVDSTDVATGSANVPVAVASVAIPAGSLTGQDIVEIAWTTLRVAGNSGIIQSQVYINTVNSLVGATQIATGANMNTAQYSVKGVRDIGVANNTARATSATSQMATDSSLAPIANTSFGWDVGTDYYLIFAVMNTASADRSTIERIRVTRYSL